MSISRPAATASVDAAGQWLAARGWAPFDFQREVWQAIAAGRSGMLPGLLQRHGAVRGAQPLRAIWLTPMRALASDTTKALTQPLLDLAPEWTIGQRTGDTPSAERARQDRRFPTVQVTTPESLTL